MDLKRLDADWVIKRFWKGDSEPLASLLKSGVKTPEIHDFLEKLARQTAPGKGGRPPLRRPSLYFWLEVAAMLYPAAHRLARRRARHFPHLVLHDDALETLCQRINPQARHNCVRLTPALINKRLYPRRKHRKA